MTDRTGQIWEGPSGTLMLIVRPPRLTSWDDVHWFHDSLLLEDGRAWSIIEKEAEPLESFGRLTRFA